MLDHKYENNYLWRYRTRDNTFMKFKDVILEEDLFYGSVYVKNKRKSSWQRCTGLDITPDIIQVHMNHYFYMWSYEDYDLNRIAANFLEFAEGHYDKLIRDYTSALARCRETSVARKKYLKKSIELYETNLDKCRDRLSKYYYDVEID